MVKAVFPGSFDPPTRGHLNLIQRGASVFDGLLVLIAENRQKKALFSLEERFALMEKLVQPWENVSVELSGGLLSAFMRERGLRVLLRGVRGMDDFAYELELSLVQRSLGWPLETVFMGTAPEFFACRSSTVKELAALGGDYTWLVPPPVAEALEGKFSPI
jgi:pantetheine-phosphate adenylyltransferase